MPIRLVLAEDHYLVREGIRRLLETQPDFEVVAACGDLGSLLDAVDAERPDVVVTDVRMPPGDADEGIQAAERLRETHPDIGVVVLSQYANASYVLALLDGGQRGRAYLLKERVKDLEQLASAIRTVADGGSVIDPKVVEELVANDARGEDSPLDRVDPARARRPARDGRGKDQRGDRGSAVPDREIGREGDPLDLPEARADVGDRSSQACQGGDPLPGGERLASAGERKRSDDPRAAVGLRHDRQLAAERFYPVTHSAELGRRAALGRIGASELLRDL